ncbi:hypothetical protein ACVMB3_007064 [Sinorhizobium meliloti]
MLLTTTDDRAGRDVEGRLRARLFWSQQLSIAAIHSVQTPGKMRYDALDLTLQCLGVAWEASFSAVTKIVECCTMELVARLIVYRLESMPNVEARTSQVAMINGQAKITVAVTTSDPGHVSQQLFTNPGAAEFLVNEQILNIEARLAHPSRKHREVEADGRNLALELGQHHGELASGTEPGGFEIVPSAFEAPDNAEGFSQQPKSQQDLLEILALGYPK